ncbi:Signal peptide, CUB and EGF-like domain-containing protein 1 [Manis javanica]|nr:Signal peptide, CUB and EGF-like domain-containing protein 1 [Manis javanica]
MVLRRLIPTPSLRGFQFSFPPSHPYGSVLLPFHAILQLIRFLKAEQSPLDKVHLVMSRDVNECTIDNGGCQDQCCNTIGSYYCKCQAGQKLEEDGRGCEDVLKMVWNSQTFSGIFEQVKICNSFPSNISLPRHQDQCTFDKVGVGSEEERASSTLWVFRATNKSAQTDVDECSVVNGGCQQRCINTLGTFHCECDTGSRLHADERTCIKMDPCTGGNGCAHICQSENGVARH